MFLHVVIKHMEKLDMEVGPLKQFLVDDPLERGNGKTSAVTFEVQGRFLLVTFSARIFGTSDAR
ncbi:hypothetical protein [Halonotius sp. GCM10025705]|uniref:hypothetical protein n=1 Tax=Halonotius sp. GCM10025705 TaxID=3252678 RepID=UPI00361F6817